MITEAHKAQWKIQNDYELNEDYIVKLLNKFNIEKYNVVINKYGHCDLLIEYTLHKYHIELDYSRCLATIKRGKRLFVSQKSSKENMPIIKTFNHHSVWYDIIKFIYKDNKI